MQARNAGKDEEGSKAFVTETLLLSIHALYIIAGLVAASTPSRGDATALTVLVSTILVYASWAITSISFVTRKTRRYLLAHGLQNRDAVEDAGT